MIGRGTAVAADTKIVEIVNNQGLSQKGGIGRVAIDIRQCHQEETKSG